MKTSLLNHARADRLTRQITPWLVTGLSVLLAAMPFHAFVVTVLGAQLGHQLVWASWKEVLLLCIAAGVIALAGVRGNWRWLQRGANRAVMIALAAGVLASFLTRTFDVAWLAGVKTTVLPLILFLAVQPLAEHFTDKRLAQLVLLPASIVAGLAVAQSLTTPTALLTSLGYGASTIVPYQGVHPGFDVARAFSTLGGPNQLGAYLILPAVWFLYRSLSEARRDRRIVSLLGCVLTLAGMAVSFSRSALLGLIVSCVVLIALYVPARWRLAVFAAAALAGYLGWLLIMDVVSMSGTALSSFFLRGTLLPTGIVGGDSGHVHSILEGVRLVLAHPLGLGFGAAGPASFFRAVPVLTENWWLQIGLELGIPGLVALMTSWYCLFRHWLTHLDALDRVMLASLSGLAVSALFLHVFADSTLALTALPLAGLIYGRHWSDKQPEETV